MNPRRNKCTFCEHFFVGSDVSPVFLPGVESICAMLPNRQLLDTYDLLEVFLAHIVLGIGQSSLERRIHELTNESLNSFVCRFALVELSALFHCFKYYFVSQIPWRIHARLSAIIWGGGWSGHETTWGRAVCMSY